MSDLTIDVWADFLCPWCYLGSHSVKEVAERTHAPVSWRAYELRPAGAPMFDAAKLSMIQRGWPMLRERARAMGLDTSVEHPALTASSHAAHVAQAAVSALLPEGDAAQRFHDAVYRAHWVEGRDIGDPEVLVELLATVGLDGDRARAALSDPIYEERVLADEREARERGIRGVPQVVMNGRLLPAGALPTEALLEIAERVKQLA